jgi:hypothetical protein
MRFYRALLWLYPASVRAEYGEEMLAVFARRRRDAAGPMAVTALWIDAVTDVVVNAVRAHVDILRQDLRSTLRSFSRTPGFARFVTSEVKPRERLAVRRGTPKTSYTGGHDRSSAARWDAQGRVHSHLDRCP